MTIYQLDPIDPTHTSWQGSDEQNSVWVNAASPEEARALVADKTGRTASGAPSPWLDPTVTSCTVHFPVRDIAPGTVVREDGSRVG